MRVEAHVHIRRALDGFNDCISARSLPTGRVYYTEQVDLVDVTFSVQPAGLAKFRRTGQKNVHAFVRGTEQVHPFGPGSWRIARYNPRNNATFVDKETGEPVYRANEASFCGMTLFYR